MNYFLVIFISTFWLYPKEYLNLLLIFLLLAINRMCISKNSGFFLDKSVYVNAILFTSIFFIIAVFNSKTIFDFLPLELDSVVQFVGSKAFTKGSFYESGYGSLNKFFPLAFSVGESKMFTQYPPGHMLLLAIANYFKSPHLLNPLFGSLSLFMTFLITKKLYNINASLLVCLLFLSSPFLIFLASEYDNRCTATFFMLCFLYFVVKNNSSLLNSLFIGISCGFFCIIRPQSAFFICPILVFLLICKHKFNILSLIKKLFLSLITFIPFVLFYLSYNESTTGNIFLTGYELILGENHSIRQLLLKPNYLQYFLLELKEKKIYFNNLGRELLSWPINCIYIIALLALLGLYKRQHLFLFLIVFAVHFGIMTTHFVSYIFGPRYLHEAAPIIIIILGIGLTRIRPYLKKKFNIKLNSRKWNLMLFFIVCVLWINQIFTNYHIKSFQYANNYRFCGNTEFRAYLNNSIKYKPAIAFVPLDKKMYNSVAYLLPSLNDNSVIIARDLGVQNVELIKKYQNRCIYLFKKTGDYKILSKNCLT